MPQIAIKRIMQEARELQNDPSTEYTAAPLEVRSSCYQSSSIAKEHFVLTLYPPPFRTTYS